MSLKERLKFFIQEHLKIGEGVFEKNAGLSNGLVSGIGEGIRSNTLNKIRKAYPELNTAWLLTGEGKMILPKSESNNELNDSGVDYVALKNINDSEALLMIIEIQRKTISSLERQLDMVKETIQSNFQKVLDSQEDISALVKGGHVYLAHHYSGGKKEKFLEELTKINNACAGDLQKV